MAVPKRKTTPSKRNMRRAHDAIKADAYVENPDTESVILEMSGLKFLGRVDLEDEFNQEIISRYADRFKGEL